MKLIKNEFIKFTYQPTTLFYFITLMLIVSGLLIMPYKFIYLINSDITQYQILFKFIVGKVILPSMLIFTIVKSTSLILFDFKMDTIKNIVVRRCSRFKIYIMRVISLYIYVLFITLLFVVAVIAYLFYDYQEILQDYVLQQWLLVKMSQFLLILFYLICLSIFISAIINNIFVSTVIMTLYTIYIPLNYQVLLQFYNQYQFINIFKLLPSYQISQLQFYSNEMTTLSINSLVMIIPILIGGALILFLISCLIYRLRERRMM